MNRSKDIIIETGAEKQYAPVPIIPTFIKIKRGIESVQALIITFDKKEVQKTAESFTNSTNKQHRVSVVQLGTIKNTKQEAFSLFKKPDIVTGTAERIIDHIRRGNIDLSEVLNCFIFEPDESDSLGFNADIQFILSKLNRNCKNVIFTPDLNDRVLALENFLKGPIIIPESQWYRLSVQNIAWQIKAEENLLFILPQIIKKENLKNNILICNNAIDGNRILSILNSEGIRTKMIPNNLNHIRSKDMEAEGSFSTYIINEIGDILAKLRGFRNIIYLNPTKPQIYKQNLTLIEDSKKQAKIITFYTPEKQHQIVDMEEKLKMKMANKKYSENKENIEQKIKEILEKIRLKEDPEEMNYYKKLFKKNVPIFLRSYFAAYLLKKMSDTRTKPNLTSIFIGAGKNRKVFPRDIIQLFTDVPGVEAIDIGEIKILDNYSFAELSADKAKNVIQKLNGKDFRGKNLTVNFARKKDQ